MILNKDKVEEAAQKSFDEIIESYNEESMITQGFKAGVKYAESKIEDICAEFGEYCLRNASKIDKYTTFDIESGVKLKDYFDTKKVFQEFLKQRDE